MIQIEIGKIYYFCRKLEVLEGVVEKLLSNSAIIQLGNERTVISFKNLYENKDEPQKVVDSLIEQKKKEDLEKKPTHNESNDSEKFHFYLEENKDLTYKWLACVYKGIQCLEVHKFKYKRDAELKLYEMGLDEKYSEKL